MSRPLPQHSRLFLENKIAGLELQVENLEKTLYLLHALQEILGSASQVLEEMIGDQPHRDTEEDDASV